MDAVYALKDEVHELKKVSVFIDSIGVFTASRRIHPSSTEVLLLHLSPFPPPIGEQMDEAVPGGRAEVPQGAGEDRQEAGQAEERLCFLG